MMEFELFLTVDIDVYTPWTYDVNGCKWNVHKMFRRSPGRVLNILLTLEYRIIVLPRFYSNSLINFVISKSPYQDFDSISIKKLRKFSIENKNIN